MARRGANLEARLDWLEKAIEGQTPAGRFDIVQALPVERAEGMVPGLYALGPPGSTAGLLVYDPALGKPQVPPGRLPPWGVLIESEGATLDSIL
ncbi:MAG TPA: hypothetical protein VGL71_10460 [Urbifossiella sp.]|jgi:hypothetical protein